MKYMRWSGVGPAAVLAAAWLAAPAVAADPQADQLYQSAVTKYGAADYQGAIKDAEAAVALDPGNWQAWQVDGNARYALGDQTGALTVYRYALQGNPNNPQLKAFVDSLAGAASPAPSAQPGRADAGTARAYETALAQYDAGNHDAAMQGCAAVVRADPNHWQAWQLLGNSRYARGDKRGALEAYDRSLALHPDNPGIRAFAESLRAEAGAAATAPSSAIARGGGLDDVRVAGAGRQYRRLSIGVWGGYSTIGLQAVSNEWTDHIGSIVADLESGGLTVSDLKTSRFSGGMVAGIEAGYVAADGVIAAMRIGYISPGSIESSFNGSGHQDFGAFGTMDETAVASGKLTTSVIPIEIGGRYSRPFNPDLTFSGGIFLGVGLASAQQENAYSDSTVGTGMFAAFSQTITSNATIPSSGSAFGGEVVVGAAYRVAANVSAGLDVGYRILKVGKMTATRDVDMDGDGTIDASSGDIRKGDVYADQEGNPVPFDYSGVEAVARVSASF